MIGVNLTSKYMPLGYEEINLYNGLNIPSHEHVDSDIYKFWCRCLYQRALSIFSFEDLPNWFNDDYINLMYYLIYTDGFCGVGNVEQFGNVVNPASPYGINVAFSFEAFKLVNAKFKKSYNFKIFHKSTDDKNVIDSDLEKYDGYGVLIKLSPDYYGILDVIDYYATKLAKMSCAQDMNIENTKFAYVFGANTNSAKTFLKKMWDKIQAGISLIVYDSRVSPTKDVESFNYFSRDNLKSSYMVDEFSADIQTLINQFDAEVGIINVPYEKKERMTKFESQSKLSDGIARARLFQRTLQQSFDDFNVLYDANVKVVYNYEYMVVEDSSDENDNTGGDINE